MTGVLESKCLGDILVSERAGAAAPATPAPVEIGTIEASILECMPDMLNVVAHYFRDAHERDEMMQEAVTRLLEKSSSFRGESPFGHWALAVTSRLCLSRVRRDKIIRFIPFVRDMFEDHSVESETEVDVLRREREKLLYDSLDTLRASDRELITLSDLAGKPDREVASILGISAGNLRVRRHRARQSLKAELLKRGYEHE